MIRYKASAVWAALCISAAGHCLGSAPAQAQFDINGVELRGPSAKPLQAVGAFEQNFGGETAGGAASTTSFAPGVAPVPKLKPEQAKPKPANLVNPWVMPTRKFTATAEEVGTPGNMICALTFDDGPHRTYDPLILDILKREGVVATFYVLGRLVGRHPEIVRRMAGEGHEIASHSWDHKDQSKLSQAAVTSDMRRTSEALGALGLWPRLYRPPYGAQNSKVRAAARANKLEIVRWTVDTLDWKSSTDTAFMVNAVKEDLGPGGTVLMHSINPRAVAALPAVIDAMKAKGCKFVTQSDWLDRVTAGDS